MGVIVDPRLSGALKDLAVVRRRHAQTATQMVAQVAPGAETGKPGHLVDRHVALLEQFTRALEAPVPAPRCPAPVRSPRGIGG